jgi:hypothetical protein
MLFHASFSVTFSLNGAHKLKVCRGDLCLPSHPLARSRISPAERVDQL